MLKLGHLKKIFKFLQPLPYPKYVLWDELDKVDSDMKKTYPYRYFFQNTLSNFIRHKIFGPFKDLWYWVRCHTFTRYHMLDLRSNVGEKYKYGWCEPDQKILLACFNLLRYYVEKQDGLAYLNRTPENDEWLKTATLEEKEVDLKQKQKYQEIKDLYDWWMNVRMVEREQLRSFYDKELLDNKGLSYYHREMALDEKDQEMLMKLISLRYYLWT